MTSSPLHLRLLLSVQPFGSSYKNACSCSSIHLTPLSSLPSSLPPSRLYLHLCHCSLRRRFRDCSDDTVLPSRCGQDPAAGTGGRWYQFDGRASLRPRSILSAAVTLGDRGLCGLLQRTRYYHATALSNQNMAEMLANRARLTLLAVQILQLEL